MSCACWGVALMIKVTVESFNPMRIEKSPALQLFSHNLHKPLGYLLH